MSSLLLLSPLSPAAVGAYSMPGIGEWIIILVIVLLVFGPKKLPMLGDSLGKGIKSFKKALTPQDEIDVTPPDQIQSGRSDANVSSTHDERTRAS